MENTALQQPLDYNVVLFDFSLHHTHPEGSEKFPAALSPRSHITKRNMNPLPRLTTHQQLRPGFASGPAEAAPSCVAKQHTDAEWAAVYPHIERLYLREGRKLRRVRAIMEEQHRFKAR